MRRGLAAAAIAAVVILPLADRDGFTALRAAVNRRELPQQAFGSARTVKLLNRLDALRMAPGEPVAGLPSPEEIGLRRRAGPQTCGRPLYGPPSSSALPSTVLAAPGRAAPAWVRRGLPVLSIAVERCRLLRLLSHPRQRGRDWEEPADVSYFDGGELRFASPAGVRLHGRLSRRAPTKSYRLYFRDLYGASSFLPGVVSGDGGAPVRQLVADRDVRADGRRRKWHFINPLAYDVTRRLGALAPRTRPVMLILNGEPQHLYALGERIAGGFLERHFGHDDFLLIRGRREDRRGEVQVAWRQLLRFAARPEPLEMPQVARHFDLENLSRWYASVIFCATTDAFQAALVHDRRRPDARWTWIAWDMDMSFRVRRQRPRFGWQRDVFDDVLRGPGRSDPKVSRILLGRLLKEDPKYRRYLAEILTEALNYRLTRRFFDERLAFYDGQLHGYGVRDREFVGELRDFFEHRPAVVREQIRTYLEPRGLHELRVSGGGELLVDGHDTGGSFAGWYLHDAEVRLAAAPGRSLSHWLVDGLRRGEPELVLRMWRATSVEAVFTDG